MDAKRFKYGFKVTVRNRERVIGTGEFTTHREFTADEQMNFLHQYTSGIYSNNDVLIINIFPLTLNNT